MFLVTWIVAEITRLKMLRKGVLYYSIPSLCVFLLLCIFPQLLVVVYLGYYQELIFPCDIALSSIMFVFLLSEIIFGSAFLKEIIHWKKQEYYEQFLEQKSKLNKKK